MTHLDSGNMESLMFTAPNTMEHQVVPMPIKGDSDIPDGEVLIKVEASGICGSDLHAYHGHDERRIPPMILGHEATGMVVLPADSPLKGKRFVLNPLISCLNCEYCHLGCINLCSNKTMLGMQRQGMLAQYVLCPTRQLVPIPDDMKPAHAALAEPTAVAVHAIVRIQNVSMRPLSESKCLIMGGGALGILFALLMKNHGCSEISIAETGEFRRNFISKNFPEFRVYNPLSDKVSNIALCVLPLPHADKLHCTLRTTFDLRHVITPATTG
eukprot:GFYU01009459.1.p1 GENE.GFYU01009459.1~~GFYU01009459.1.p1  ORF type:complete len:270 (-),score=46.97 GFYU01009459.1:566-1375(-)